MIVANDAVATIGASEAEVTLIDSLGVAQSLPRGSKAVVARAIIDAVVERFSERLGRERPLSEDHQHG
jgi:hypothetical protein